MTCRKISTDNLDVAIFENVADVTLGTVLHTCSLYVTHNFLPPVYPLFGTCRGDMRRTVEFLNGRDMSRQAATGRDVPPLPADVISRRPNALIPVLRTSPQLFGRALNRGVHFRFHVFDECNGDRIV